MKYIFVRRDWRWHYTEKDSQPAKNNFLVACESEIRTDADFFIQIFSDTKHDHKIDAQKIYSIWCNLVNGYEDDPDVIDGFHLDKSANDDSIMIKD